MPPTTLGDLARGDLVGVAAANRGTQCVKRAGTRTLVMNLVRSPAASAMRSLRSIPISALGWERICDSADSFRLKPSRPNFAIA